MNWILILHIIFFSSCSRYYYRTPEKPQTYYIENLSGQNISLVSFLEMRSETKTTTTTHFSSSGKVSRGPSQSTSLYPADEKSRLNFGTGIKETEIQEGLNPNQNKEGVAHFLKRYNESPPKLKKLFLEEIRHLFEFKKEFSEKDVIHPEDVSLKNLDTSYLLFGNLREDPPEVKVQVFYFVPYIFISAFSLFTIPVIADTSNTTEVYHLYDRDMKLLKTFQARLDVIEIAAWWTKLLPKFERECVDKSADPNEDLCPRGIKDIRFFLLRKELNDYFQSNTIPGALILKSGRKITGSIHEKDTFYIVTDNKGNTQKILKADVLSLEF